MSGPLLVIDLPEPLSPASLRELRALMVGLSSRFEEKRPGFFDVNVLAERLGVEDRREEDWRKPFPLRLLGDTGADEGLAALVTAAVMDVVGGVAKAELLDGHVPVVAGLPGVVGITDDGWTALGTAEFLRAWVGHPAFRLVK